MTVYVDNALIPATVGRTRSRWCHLTADTQEELHAFAARVGMRREWFQTCKRRCGREGDPCIHWHYDLTTSRRARAVSLGAVEIDMNVMGEILRGRRAVLRAAESTKDGTADA